ncbi:MAG: hypothetical protein WC314_22680 [Vulcanimicrobiota bacterium]
MKPTRALGFSLLEVILGGLIMGAALTGMATLWMTHQRVLRESRDRLMATFILQSEMERCLAQGFHSIPAVAAEDPQEVVTERTFGTTRGTNTTTTSFLTDVFFENNGDETMRRVWVTVTYEDSRHGLRTLELETFVFKNE